MSIKYVLMGLGLGVALGTLSIPAMGQNDSTIVAEIGSRKVTAGELEQKEASKLLQARYKLYVAERDALQQYIDEQILEMQAQKESVTVEELLKRHASGEQAEPTEDQLRFYYEGVQADEPYATARPHIIETVRQLRMKKAREVYITELRANYGVVVELNQPSVHVEAGNAPRLGPENAPVQVIEYADYECPYCQKVNADLIRLHEQFGDKVSIVYKDFPLPMHPLAAMAAEGARCAGVQGKFWEFHDFLFESKKLQVPDMKAEARALKLDGARFDECLDKRDQFEGLKKDAQDAQRLGLQGTPSFFINDHFMSGAISYAKLRDTVQQELAIVKSAAMTPLQGKNEEKK